MRALMITMRKEMMEASRTRKLLVLTIVALFFALSGPVMLKMTPYLLKEFSGIDVADAIELSQTVALRDFAQDVGMVFTVVLVIVAAPLWIQEVTGRSLVIPLTKGTRSSHMILAKGLVYGIWISLLMIVAYSVNYYYAGIIFGFDLTWIQVFRSALMMGMFYFWLVFFILLLGTLFANSYMVVFTVLVTVFGGGALAGLVRLDTYLPFGLVTEAGIFGVEASVDTWITLGSTLILMIASYLLSAMLAARKEIVRYR